MSTGSLPAGTCADSRLPGMRANPALLALTDTMRQALTETRDLLRQGDRSEAIIATVRAHLHRVQGAFGFCGAHSLQVFAALLCELADSPGMSSGLPGTVRALDAACRTLIAALPSLQRAQPVPAGWLMPCWRDVAAQLPGPVPSVAALISLYPPPTAAAEAALTALLRHVASRPARACPSADIDKLLLELLRAEAGSDALRTVLQPITAAIADRLPSIGRREQQLHWAVMLVYAELLAGDAPFDLALAKKTLSAVVRVMRHGPPERASGTALPETLVREALLQIGLFAPATPVSQSVREGFSLSSQLAPADDRADAGNADDASQLLAQLDELEASWAGIDQAERHRRLDALMPALRSHPVGAVLSARLADIAAPAEPEHELPLAAALLIVRTVLEATRGIREDEGLRQRAGKAIETLAARSGSGWTSSQQQWAFLQSLAPGLPVPAARRALKHAVSSALTDTEQRLDILLDSGESAALKREMGEMLDIVAGAFAVAGATEALSMAASLRQALEEADPTASASVASQWVQLSAWVDVWPEQDCAPQSPCSEAEDTVEDAPAPEVENAGDPTSDAAEPPLHTPVSVSASSPLGQIFIKEATQRLSRLRESLSSWASQPGERLPLAAAHEAHALAGSSATVGRARLHDGSLALEQAIERLARQPVAQQRHHAEAVVRGVQALEQELRMMQQADTLQEPSGDPSKDPAVLTVRARTESVSSQASACPASRLSEPLQALQVLSEQLPAGEALPEDLQNEPPDELKNELQDDFPDEPPAPTPDARARPAVPSTDRPLQQTVTALPGAASDQASDSPGREPGADEELLAVFSEEAAELLPQLVQLHADWMATPQDGSLPPRMLRVLHTLKGSARMAGEMSLGEQLHRMEHEVAQLARMNRPTDASLQDLRRQLICVLTDAGLDPEAAMQTFSASLTQDAPIATDRPAADAGSGLPKVRTDLLERAASSAAELLVGAVRATEDLQQQRHTVADLGENLARLRGQLRELELQSESRIAAQAQPSASVFDPLEFDRYTRLQELTRMTSESLADLTSLQRSLARQSDAAAAVLSQQTRHARLLQSDLRRASMQAFSSTELRMRHLVRQAASEAGREVRFEMEGGQVEIDRAQLDRLNGALQHLIRNAVVHGIEPPEQRERLGKPRAGVVRMALSQQGSELRLQISDDGRGLDVARIRERAAALGVLDSAAIVDDAQLAELIFAPGLSTADEVTGLAGRGIGMDAVKAAVMQMGGALKVDSLPGAGTCITLALPQLLSTQQVLVVADGGYQAALPAGMVQHLMQPDGEALLEAMTTGSIEWQRQSMPLRSLAALLGEGSEAATGVSGGAKNSSITTQHRASVIVLRQLDQWLAVRVSEVLGHREVVAKQAGPQLAGVAGLAGATLQPDGSVLLIMNLLQWSDQHGTNARSQPTRSSADPISDKVPLVMVVDDSLTVRRVSQRLLERRGYAVRVARHGVEALEQLREETPAALLLDIEMPRMDGFELLSRLRADPRLAAVPVAMVTSRAAERHRQHAMQLGANAYFGKPYREQDIFDWLAQCAPVPGNEAPDAGQEESVAA